MSKLIRPGLTVAALVPSGYLVAALSANVTIAAFDQPGQSGKFGIQFGLAFTLILGWALGASLETVWRDPPEREWGDALAAIGLQIMPRLLLGLVIFFVVTGIEFGFEALGVGLGG